MRSLAPRLLIRALAFVPLAALALACGDGSDLPTGTGRTGRWQPNGAGSSGGATSSSSGGSGDTSSSSSGGQTGSSSGTTGSSGGSGGTSSGTGSSSGGGGSSSGSGSSSGGTPPANPPNLGVSVDQGSLQMQLLANGTVHVSVAPNGYAGSVTLGAGTLPAGVTATFSPATLDLDGNTAGTATLTIATVDNTPPGTVTLDVQAMADGTTAHASVSVEVQSIITIHIPAGVNNLGGTVQSPVTSAYGPYPFKIVAPQNISSSPVTVYFINDDGTSHEIHADNPDQGFGHDPGPFGAHSMDPYVRQVNAVGSYDFYLHDQGAPITIGLVEVQ
jgi:hypothetical protein